MTKTTTTRKRRVTAADVRICELTAEVNNLSDRLLHWEAQHQRDLHDIAELQRVRVAATTGHRELARAAMNAISVLVHAVRELDTHQPATLLKG